MIWPYKGRDYRDTALVFVYRNLHKRQWSVMALDGKYQGLVVAHADHVRLEFPRWRVNETGRQQVLRTRCKNVHAGVIGLIADDDSFEDGSPKGITWFRCHYNPYQYSQFMREFHGGIMKPWTSSRWAMFDMQGHAWSS